MLEQLAVVVDWWCSNGTGDVVLFAFSKQGDYESVRELSDMVMAGRLTQVVEYPERLHLLGPDLDPRTFKGIVGVTRGMIAVRLHAQILPGRPGVLCSD
jgi:hypothetical protein